MFIKQTTQTILCDLFESTKALKIKNYIHFIEN